MYPAIAIADAVRALVPEAAIAFVGTRDRMEWEAVPKAGFPIHPISGAGFQRGLNWDAMRRNVSLPVKLAGALRDSLGIIKSFQPDVVVATGGYVTGPVGAAAAMKRRPLILQEQNAYAGATNKLLARFAQRIFVAFAAAQPYFPEGRTEVSGNPVRADLSTADPAAAREFWQVTDGARVLLVMGGSLGAGPVNDAIEADIQRLLNDQSTFVIWQTGPRYFDAIADRLPEHARLKLMPYLEHMHHAYAAADLVVCRAGAITCSELAVTGTPAILIPSPNVTADHQTKNARALADLGAAALIPEHSIKADLFPTISELMGDEGKLQEMSRRALESAKPKAAEDIARVAIEMASTRIAESTADAIPGGTR